MSDLCAGLTVGVVALPLAMAFAIACGLPPEKGLVTAIVAGLLISLFSGSRFQIGGPTGAFVIIIIGVISQYGMTGLLMSTLMAGGFLLIFGFCKMGALIRFIPFPVTTGFTAGIAVVIFSTQVKDLFGLTIPKEIPADFLEKWSCYGDYMGTCNYWALGLSVLTILVILIVRRQWPKLPAMLIGMLVATCVAVMWNVPVETIGDKFGSLPDSLPMPEFPVLDFSQMHGLVLPAFTIALLAAIESLLSASVADGMTGTRHRPNAELIAQGVGNIGSALFLGIPATGAIARTATNIKAGGKTPVSGIIHAVTLFAILMLFGSYAVKIPLCVLGGILAVVCWNMSEMHVFSRLARGPRSDAAVLVITFLLTVLVDLIVAVEVGVVLAALLFMGRMAQMSGVKAFADQIGDDDALVEDPSRQINLRTIPKGVEVFDVKGPFFFGAVDQFKELAFNHLEYDLKCIILRMRLVPVLDATGLHVLGDFFRQCQARQINLIICGVQPQPWQVISKAPALRRFPQDNVCVDIDAALARANTLLEQGSLA